MITFSHDQVIWGCILNLIHPLLDPWLRVPGKSSGLKTGMNQQTKNQASQFIMDDKKSEIYFSQGVQYYEY